MRSFFKTVERDDNNFQDKLEFIYSNLRKYDNAIKYIPDKHLYDHVKELIGFSKTLFGEIINKGLKELLLTLDGFITNNNYYEVQKLKSKIDTIRELLEKKIEAIVLSEIDSLSYKLNASLKALVS